MLGGCLTYCAISNEIFQKKSVTELWRLWKLQGARVKIRLNYCRDMPKIEEKKKDSKDGKFPKIPGGHGKIKGGQLQKVDILNMMGTIIFWKIPLTSWRVYQEV